MYHRYYQFQWQAKKQIPCENNAFVRTTPGVFRHFSLFIDDCPATFCSSLQYMTLMHLHRDGCLGLSDALLCCLCQFTVRANNALVSTTGGVVSLIFSAFTIVLARVVGAGIFLLCVGNPPGRPPKRPSKETLHRDHLSRPSRETIEGDSQPPRIPSQATWTLLKILKGDPSRRTSAEILQGDSLRRPPERPSKWTLHGDPPQ